MRILYALLLVLYCALGTAAHVPLAGHYKIANKIHIGGEGGWDLLAVDETTNRVYLSHTNRVEVLDAEAGKVVGVIDNTQGVHGVALALGLKKGYITCGKADAVAVFDTESLKITSRVKTGKNPDAIVFEPSTQRVFAFNGGGGSATVIDAKTDAVVGTLPLDGKPELPAVDGAGTVYVNLEDKSMVKKIDAKEMKVVATWPLAPGEEPTGLALDVQGHRLFAACHNKLMVILNVDDGKAVQTLPIGERVDGAAFDPGLKRAYSANGDGTLTVIQEKSADKFEVLETVPTQKGARTIAINTRTHHLFLPVAELGAAPAATPENPRPRPTVMPGTFTLVDVAPGK